MIIRRLTIFIFILLLYNGSTLFAQSCNNWLNVPNQPSFVRVGDLDITGDKVTVEATFNRTSPWVGADVFQGDLVSKHEDVTDCNYVLRPGSAEITTTNGYFKTPTICNIELNKTYHAAFVYDGAVLKFYRNGFLMSQIAASGSLVQNNWQTQIGLYFNQRTAENFIGYINEVRIWNVARSQAEIRAFMNQSLPAPTTTPGLQAYYTFDNLLNKQGNATWNGTLSGNATINRVNPSCTFVADSCNTTVTCPPSDIPDFSYVQSVCDPGSLDFSSNLGANQRLVSWDFGNGQSNTASTSPSVFYSAFGSYAVKLKVANSPGCFDSVTKVIDVNVYQAQLLANEDTTVCAGDTVKLNPFNTGLAFCWASGAGVLSTTDTSYQATPLATTTYVYTSKQLGVNLVANANFDGGNVGFSSGYPASSSGTPQGVYTVGSNPATWNSAMASCRDHTNGFGNMMLVNGSAQAGTIIWEQSIQVLPNTAYSFGTWVQAISLGTPAQLQFVINGKRMGNSFITDMQSCTWKQIFLSWNSGTSTVATIAIIDLGQSASASDYALDDLFFGEVVLQRETVKVTVAPKPEISLGSNLKSCLGDAIQLSSTIVGASSISWTPALYLDNPNSATPISTPLNNITYVAEVRSTAGCVAKDSLQVEVIAKPVLTIRGDTAICQETSVELTTQASNATSFTWVPGGTLSNPSQLSPVARPFVTTNYKLTAFNNGCSTTDSILITVKELPIVTLSNDTLVCEMSSVPLFASGGNQYLWSPASTLSVNNTPNPIATPLVTTTYRVDVQNGNGCVKTDSVQVEVKSKPVFSLEPSVQSICLGDTAVFTAAGGDRYSWFPVDSVLLASPQTARVSPRINSVYQVQVTDSICNISETLSATVVVKQNPAISITKSNDIDCSSAEAQLNVVGGSSYQWSPAIGLTNAFVADPRASPVETTTYTVIVSSAEGCKSQDSITVNVSATGKSGFYIPNAFTPNRDGTNDCFGIRNWGPVDEFEIKVFNRWGEMVFASSSSSFCWDGLFRGREQPSGVFVYYINAKARCGNVFKKGTITLLR